MLSLLRRLGSLLGRVVRVTLRFPSLLVLAMAAALGGVPRPKFIRHQDDVVQVAEDEKPP
jgi:hypothetical protein